MTRQASFAPGQAEAALARGVHTFMVVPLTARRVTLGVTVLARAENPKAHDQADVRLVSDLASRAAVHIDNARLYTREHTTALTLQRSLAAPRHPPGGRARHRLPLPAGQPGRASRRRLVRRHPPR